MKTVAISQSNYIPWRGYFDLIGSVDEFVLYDDMQFTRRDWRNRNKIKTPSGTHWLSIPVKVKGKYQQKIKDTVIDDCSWKNKHFGAITQNYKQAPYFAEIISLLEPVYCKESFNHLSKLNHRLITIICNYLKIQTKITWSMNYNLIEGKTERLVDLCMQCGADRYISGPAAKDYVNETLFANKNIALDWFNYADYSEYTQLWAGFSPNVSVLDLLFNCGPDSINYLPNCQRHIKVKGSSHS